MNFKYIFIYFFIKQPILKNTLKGNPSNNNKNISGYILYMIGSAHNFIFLVVLHSLNFYQK